MTSPGTARARRCLPYGVYDITGNNGWVSVGTDHDTAAFAVESVRRWWKAAGSSDYPAARRLLITSDAGGSGYRSRGHFPPGTGPGRARDVEVEQGGAPAVLPIAMNWCGRPPISHEVIVQTIAATITRTGLRVRAELDASAYDAGVKVSDRQMDALPRTCHDWRGDWNYTLRSEDYD